MAANDNDNDNDGDDDDDDDDDDHIPDLIAEHNDSVNLDIG